MKGDRILVYILKFLKHKIWIKIVDKPFITNKGKFFIFNLIFAKIKGDGMIGSEEFEVAKLLLIKQAQFIFHSNTKKFNTILMQLGAWIHKQGIIRCCGRLKNSDLDEVKKISYFITKKIY